MIGGPGAVFWMWVVLIAATVIDARHGLLMIPNLIGVVARMPLLARITKNYVSRVIKGASDEAMLSYAPAIQQENNIAAE